jgi:hypothetical protein
LIPLKLTLELVGFSACLFLHAIVAQLLLKLFEPPIDGQIVLVTRLCEGQRATVLQLPASPRVTREAQEQMHASAVA